MGSQTLSSLLHPIIIRRFSKAFHILLITTCQNKFSELLTTECPEFKALWATLVIYMNELLALAWYSRSSVLAIIVSFSINATFSNIPKFSMLKLCLLDSLITFKSSYGFLQRLNNEILENFSKPWWSNYKEKMYTYFTVSNLKRLNIIHYQPKLFYVIKLSIRFSRCRLLVETSFMISSIIRYSLVPTCNSMNYKD